MGCLQASPDGAVAWAMVWVLSKTLQQSVLADQPPCERTANNLDNKWQALAGISDCLNVLHLLIRQHVKLSCLISIKQASRMHLNQLNQS